MFTAAVFTADVRRVVCGLLIVCGGALASPQVGFASDGEAAKAVAKAAAFKQNFGMELAENVAGRVTVSNVLADSPATAAGIKKGDIILTIDGKPANASGAVVDLLSGKKSGDRVALELSRDQRKQEATLIVVNTGDAPAPVTKPGEEVGLLGMFLVEDPRGRMLVSSVSPESPADRVGIVKGDLITAIGGHTATFRQQAEMARKIVEGKKLGDTIEVTVLRDGDEEEVELTVGGANRPGGGSTPRVARAVTRDAVAVLSPVGDSKAAGVVRFHQTNEGLGIEFIVEGLEPGNYHLVIHKFGDASDLTKRSAGGVYAPTKAPNNDARPIGHLAAFQPDKNGRVTAGAPFAGLSLGGADSVLGRLVALYAVQSESEPLGHPIAHGVIGIANPLKPTEPAAAETRRPEVRSEK